jgi:hypothetical protein
MLQFGVAYLCSVSGSNRCNDCGIDNEPLYTDDRGRSWRFASYRVSRNDVCIGARGHCWCRRCTGVNELAMEEIPQHWSAFSQIWTDLSPDTVQHGSG